MKARWPEFTILCAILLLVTTALASNYNYRRLPIPTATPTAVILEATPAPVAELHCAAGETACMVSDDGLTWRVWCCTYEPRKWAEEVLPREGKR